MNHLNPARNAPAVPVLDALPTGFLPRYPPAVGSWYHE